jgi:hypothetical protein
MKNADIEKALILIIHRTLDAADETANFLEKVRNEVKKPKGKLRPITKVSPEK